MKLTARFRKLMSSLLNSELFLYVSGGVVLVCILQNRRWNCHCKYTTDCGASLYVDGGIVLLRTI
jgi:hypothetical protein